MKNIRKEIAYSLDDCITVDEHTEFRVENNQVYIVYTP